MPDLKISQLAAGTTPLAGTELVPIVQSGVTSRTTVQAIMTSTVPSGTANGVLYLNGSKVATSGSALTFNGSNFKLSTTDSAFIAVINGATKGVRFGADTVGGYVEGVDNTGAGSYQPLFVGGSETRFLVSGSEQMRLTSTGLGIGTAPVSKLTVQEANRANSTNLGNLNVYTTTAQAVDVGATIALGGMFSVSQNAPFGSIRGGKENSTDNNYNGYLAFQTIQNASVLTERMRLDSSGNLGLGVAPSAWGSSYKAMQFPAGAISADSTAVIEMRQNSRWTGSANAYVNNGFASNYYQYNGIHAWFTAPSGTAGNAISFTQALTLDANRNLALNTTSVGTSAVGALSIGSGTEPSSGPADTVQLYSVDRSAGNTIPAFYCEGTGVTDAGITNTTVTHKIAMKINGTVYYLLATTNAT